jgi:hypothetical protein
MVGLVLLLLFSLKWFWHMLFIYPRRQFFFIGSLNFDRL